MRRSNVYVLNDVEKKKKMLRVSKRRPTHTHTHTEPTHSLQHKHNKGKSDPVSSRIMQLFKP